MTREDVLNKAISYIKSTPYPNPNEFTRFQFKDNKSHAWCGAFIHYIIKHDFNDDMLESCSNFGGVGDIYRWAKKMGYFNADFTKAKKGDLVIFNFTEKKDWYSHIGIVESVTSSVVNSVDGNTNYGSYKNNCVVRKIRNKKYVVGIVQLPYKEEGMKFKYGDYVKCLKDTKLYTTIEKKESKNDIKKGDIAFVRSTKYDKYMALAEVQEPHNYFPSAWTDELDNFEIYNPSEDYKKLYEEEVAKNKILQDKINKALVDLQ